MTADQWLSPQQLADELGCAVATVYRWNHFGSGPPYARLGRRVRYRRSDIEEWLESRMRNPLGEAAAAS